MEIQSFFFAKQTGNGSVQRDHKPSFVHEKKGGFFVVGIRSRVFSRGSGGGRRPPPDFGGKFVPPRGGTNFDLGKKDMGGGWGSPAQTPIWDTTYVTCTRKKKGGQGVERVLSPSWHHCEEDIAR